MLTLEYGGRIVLAVTGVSDQAEEDDMPSLKGTVTEQNLRDAFAAESRANHRCLDFAQKADAEGYNDVAAVFRSIAEGETGHAHGHLEYLEEVGDPGATGDNLKAAIASETHEHTDMYPGMARVARQEGFDEIADWFETLAKAGKAHVGRFQRALDALWLNRSMQTIRRENPIGGKYGRRG